VAQTFVYKVWYTHGRGSGDSELWLDREYTPEEIASDAPAAIRQSLSQRMGADIGPITITQSAFLRVQNS